MKLILSKILHVEKLVNIVIFNFLTFGIIYFYNNTYYSWNWYVSSVNIKLCFNYFTSIVMIPWIKYKLYGAVFSTYFKELILDGLYYRVKYYRAYNVLGFILGYNHYILYKIPFNISVKVHMKKRKFILYSFDVVLLNKVVYEIMNLKYPNIYKGRGIRIGGSSYRRKNILKKTK